MTWAVGRVVGEPIAAREQRLVDPVVPAVFLEVVSGGRFALDPDVLTAALDRHCIGARLASVRGFGAGVGGFGAGFTGAGRGPGVVDPAHAIDAAVVGDLRRSDDPDRVLAGLQREAAHLDPADEAMVGLLDQVDLLADVADQIDGGLCAAVQTIVERGQDRIAPQPPGVLAALLDGELVDGLARSVLGVMREPIAAGQKRLVDRVVPTVFLEGVAGGRLALNPNGLLGPDRRRHDRGQDQSQHVGAFHHCCLPRERAIRGLSPLLPRHSNRSVRFTHRAGKGPGRPGRLPAKGSHRPERAQLTHSVPQIIPWLRHG